MKEGITHASDIAVSSPCYNEEQNVETFVREAGQVLSGFMRRYEILIINDGSSVRTGFITDKFGTQTGGNLAVILRAFKERLALSRARR